jgi:K+-sensing histidine kinase KdpD
MQNKFAGGKRKRPNKNEDSSKEKSGKNKFNKKRKFNKFNKPEKVSDEKLNANEEFKKLILGDPNSMQEEENLQESERLKQNENIKKMKLERESMTKNLEKEHSHIFGSKNNLEEIIKKQREKLLTKNFHDLSTPTTKIKVNSLLGRNIVNYLGDKLKNKNTYNFLESSGTLKNKIENFNKLCDNSIKKVRLEVNSVALEKLKNSLEKIKIKEHSKNAISNKFEDEHEEDIFKDVEEIHNDQSQILKNINQDDEDDIFKYKDIDLGTLLSSKKLNK